MLGIDVRDIATGVSKAHSRMPRPGSSPRRAVHTARTPVLILSAGKAALGGPMLQTCRLRSLRSTGARSALAGVAVSLLGLPAQAQQEVSTVSAAGSAVPVFTAAGGGNHLRAAGFSTSSCLQAKHTRKSDEQKEQHVQQLMSEFLPQLEPLGMSSQLLRKVLTCGHNDKTVMTASTAGQLKDRLNNIYQLAAAHTEEQRKLVNTQLQVHPRILAMQASQVAANAAELEDILGRQFNIPAVTVQQFITKQLAVLRRKPQSVAHNLEGWASALHLDAATVVRNIWCRATGASITNLSSATVAAKVQYLQSVLHLGAGDVSQMVLAQPTVLTNNPVSKLQVLSQLLGSYGWTQQQLGQAVLRYSTILTRSVDSLKFKWDVFHQYAAAHRPSQHQMQEKCTSSAILNIFKTPTRSIQLMQYILQYHQHLEQQQHQHLVASSADTAPPDGQQIGRHRRGYQQHKMASNSSNGMTVKEAPGSLPTHPEWPLVWRFTQAHKDNVERLAAGYPGFREWLQQQ